MTMNALPVVITALFSSQLEGIIGSVQAERRCEPFHRIGFNPEGNKLLATVDLSDEHSAGIALAVMANICEVHGVCLDVAGFDIEGDMYAGEDDAPTDWWALLAER